MPNERTSRPPPRTERATDRYVVKERLASGGMGTVDHVIDRETGEARALKRIRAEAADQPFAIEAFEREYQVLAGLDHPRIIRVFDYGVDESGPYYAMELLEGRDMKKAAPLPYRDACLYLRDVATSLALLHARRLLHRDLSPANVRMTSDGHCKLLDFGALTAFGASPMIVGTPPVIPPEALSDAPLDQRADLYSLGALGYWMLTGRHAFPAKRIEQLLEVWSQTPAPPSAIVPEIPADLDALILSLLSSDPLARPASAAEVIARLNVIAELPPEEQGDHERLAQSFLLSPRFTGRTQELAALEERTSEASEGRGSAVLLTGVAGMGRTRLLEEVAVRAQIAGATVLRADASMSRQSQGTARALVLQLLDALPDVGRARAGSYRPALAALGREVEARLPPPVDGEDATGTLEDFLADVSRDEPLVLAIDNVEYADPASLGLLAGVAKLAPGRKILVVVAERLRRDSKTTVGLSALRSQCTYIELPGLSPQETLDLAESLFGNPPHVARFAEWLHGRTAGSPLHCVEISRQLVARQVVRYVGGMWVLPADRPDAELPAALEDALSMRLASLGEEARGLAECLSLQREPPTLALCRSLFEGDPERQVLALLDELARFDVLHADRDGYRFSSTALRDALLGGMDAARREQNHRRLGEALLRMTTRTDTILRIEAGWHLIRGGDALRGADTIASVTHDGVTVRKLIANLHHAGEPLEAALLVYKRQRRSVHERAPLLTALAQAGYYEERIWGERYGDEALDVVEDLSGLRLANRLRPWLGRGPSLILGLAIAFVRFYLVPRRERHYSFYGLLVQLFGVVTTLSGAASLSLDVERAIRVTNVLEPFSILPKRSTPVGIFEFCRALSEIGREHQAAAFETFGTIVRRFENPKYYPSLGPGERQLVTAGAHFARGAFAIFRSEGHVALTSADALDACGLKLYRMIASQLRFLYHANRGEMAKAEAHREQVDVHAAHVGSAWQVETWEPPALIPIHTILADVLTITRIEARLSTLSRSVPSLRLYYRLARSALFIAQHDFRKALASYVDEEAFRLPPRSFVGWATVHGFLALAHNRVGQHEEALRVCESAIRHLTDVDREYVAHFLTLDIEMAYALAGLGSVDEAMERLDRLLERFRNSDHPIVHGRLNEARARIAWNAGRPNDYRTSLAQVERWYRPTGTPLLLARYERLAEIGQGAGGSVRPPIMGTPASDSAVRRAREASEVTTETDQDVATAHAPRRRS